MPEWLRILVPVSLVAQGLLVQWAAGGERLPAPPDLSRFPAAFGAWERLQEDPIDPAVAGELQADQLLSRTYIRRQDGSVAALLVAWFQSQRSGTRQPHSPKVCLPASGWTPETTGELMLHTAAGVIAVNRYTITNSRQRAVAVGPPSRQAPSTKAKKSNTIAKGLTAATMPPGVCQR
jgi:hypothetical protein